MAPMRCRYFSILISRRNEATTTDHYRMPTDAEIFQRVKGDVFSTIDLYRGYHQFRVAEADRPKTAFWGGMVLWQYVKMPTGLKNAGACFQRGMDMTLANFNETWRRAGPTRKATKGASTNWRSTTATSRTCARYCGR